MAYTTINKGSLHMNTKLYTGNGAASHAITGVGFQPDFTWIKRRNATYDHALFDALRGVEKMLISNTTAAQNNQSNGVKAFGTDGFTVGDFSAGNINTSTYTSWNWKANGQGSSNTDGSINTTYTSANTTAGISIIKYNGNGSANATIGHGLGVKPNYLIIKKTNGTENWVVQNSARGFNKYMYLDTGNAENTHSGDFVASVSSTLITLGTNGSVNNGSGEYICYAFANKNGFSKFGSYTGNGNADGPMIYTGFAPSFVLVKNASGSESWHLWDNKRSPFNMRELVLYPNGTSVEEDVGADIDIISNGFKLRSSSTSVNGNGNSFTYMAFGQSIVGTNDVTAKAR